MKTIIRKYEAKAVQWTGDNLDEVSEVIDDLLILDTINSWRCTNGSLVQPGDWFVQVPNADWCDKFDIIANEDFINEYGEQV